MNFETTAPQDRWDEILQTTMAKWKKEEITRLRRNHPEASTLPDEWLVELI